MRQQRQRMLSWVSHTLTDPPVVQERYMVEGTGPVCPDFARAAYDMHRVWKPMHATAVNRTLRADEDAADKRPQLSADMEAHLSSYSAPVYSL